MLQSALWLNKDTGGAAAEELLKSCFCCVGGGKVNPPCSRVGLRMSILVPLLNFFPIPYSGEYKHAKAEVFRKLKYHTVTKTHS